MELKYYVCEKCGNLVEMVEESGMPMRCCGQQMTEIKPGTEDAVIEKHVPAVSVDGCVVNVVIGEVEHPMLEDHYIKWISIKTKQGSQRKTLKPGDAPKACFVLCEGDELIKTYAYCNLHGLWEK